MTVNNYKLSLIILAFISSIFLAVLIWEVRNIQLKNEEASELLALADKSAEAKALQHSIRMAQQSAVENLAAFDSLTLSDKKLALLIENIEEVGQELGLDNSIVSVGKVENTESIEPDIIRIVIDTQGPWAQILSFLRAIESLPHRVMIEESRLSTSEAGRRLDGTYRLSSQEASWRSRIIFSLHSFN